MDKNSQLSRSAKKWNEETDLVRWEKHYFEDSYNGNRLRAREKKVLEYLDCLNLPKRSKILELGYGAGITSAKIYSRGFDLTGIDISSKLQKLAIKNCKRVKDKASGAVFKFGVGNAEKLDFSDNSFDCVVGLGFIHYLAYPLSCLKEAYRILKPKGYFIITQRNMYGISSVDGPIKWARSLYYLATNQRYELRWQDTFLIYPFLALSTLASPLSKKMKKLKHDLVQHKRIGLVRKKAISFSRLKKNIKKSGLVIVKNGGAGYLTKKNVLFPKTAKRLDAYLQRLSDSKEESALHKVGNSVVFLAQKRS